MFFDIIDSPFYATSLVGNASLINVKILGEITNLRIGFAGASSCNEFSVTKPWKI